MNSILSSFLVILRVTTVLSENHLFSYSLISSGTYLISSGKINCLGVQDYLFLFYSFHCLVLLMWTECAVSSETVETESHSTKGHLAHLHIWTKPFLISSVHLVKYLTDILNHSLILNHVNEERWLLQVWKIIRCVLNSLQEFNKDPSIHCRSSKNSHYLITTSYHLLSFWSHIFEVLDTLRHENILLIHGEEHKSGCTLQVHLAPAWPLKHCPMSHRFSTKSEVWTEKDCICGWGEYVLIIYRKQILY